MILAGDIGGTKTLLALFAPETGAREPIDLRSWPTDAERGPADLVRDYLQGRSVRAAAIGVAGAVIDGAAGGSNLPWTVRRDDLEAAAGAPTALINDLHAVARWIPELRDDDVATLQAGRPVPGGAIGVVAPGTGMGESMLVWVDGLYRPQPSEAGHVDFAPADDLQGRWWARLRKRFGHVSLERACSGASLPALVEFLAEDRSLALDPHCAGEIAAAADPTPVIVAAGLADRCEVCRSALVTFTDMLAAAAGNLALQIVATGGIYLGGGMSPRLLPLLDTDRWRSRFREKGRFGDLMERIPARVILDDRAGLFGAARCALETVSGAGDGPATGAAPPC